MTLSTETIAKAIDEAALNRGVSGADWLACEGNIPITFDNGDIALFDYEGPGAYQVHFLFNARGRLAIDHAREALRIMFEEHDAKLIFGLTPTHLRHARIFSRWIGGKSAGIRSMPDGPCELFVLSNIMWKAH